MSNISRETSARLFDKRICDRFANISRAINVVLNENARETAIAEQIARAFECDIIGALRACARSSRANLRDVMERYNLIAAPLVAEGTNDSRYFALLSSARIDSNLCLICARMYAYVVRVMNIVEAIRAQESTQGCRNSGSAPKSNARARDGPHSRSRSAASIDIRACAIVCFRAIERAREEDPHEDPRAALASLGASLNAAASYITRAIDAIEPVRRTDNGAELRCSHCNIFMRAFEPCVAVCDQCGRMADINITQARARRTSSGGSSLDGRLTRAESRRGGFAMQQLQDGIAESRDDALSDARQSARGNFARHLRIWLDRLQAIENFEISSDDLARLRTSIASEHAGGADSVNWRAITCADVARHQSLCGLSRLGEHIPKIVKLLGGRAPPILGYDTEQLIARDFARIMDIYAQLFPDGGNKPYYPFFVAKIIKQRFARDDEVRRLLDFVSCQGRETVTKNDRVYKAICDAAPAQYGLVYVPEDV